MRLAHASPSTTLSPPPLGEVARGRAGEGPITVDTHPSPPALSQRESELFWLAATALVVVTIVSRLVFMTQTLYAFDSANYALGVRDFYNVAFHQPHPPGYPLYVFFARGIDLVVHDANRSLILEGIAWSALAMAATIALGRAMFGRTAGLLGGLLLLCTVGFWGYGEVAYPYVALAGETATLAWLAHSVLTGHHRSILLLGLMWAISAGVRWDAAVFCLPLGLWALWTVPWRLRWATVSLAARLVLVLYLVGKRFGPAHLAADYRSRFLGLWIVPPLLVYVFAHLGEPGYILSLAPAASMLIGLAILDLRAELVQLGGVLHARGWRWLPPPRLIGLGGAALLSLAILGWNVQAFARGVGPGRLPDLRAHDATTGAQIDFVRQQPVATTIVLAHDIFRQLHFYIPGYRSELLFSEYVPDFTTARTRTELPAGTEQIVVLDSPLQVAPEDAGRVHEVVVRDEPRVSVWLVDAQGASAVEHGYHFLRLLGG
ncbi:MAG: glycosyltransferase family 39 protein [Chloroflexi bacterium]|nr:glycosyltransferase family 39 protein [Chloroflexota bacterium]